MGSALNAAALHNTAQAEIRPHHLRPSGSIALAARWAENSVAENRTQCLCWDQTAPSYLAEICTPMSVSVNRSNLHSAAHISFVLLYLAPEQRDIDEDLPFLQVRPVELTTVYREWPICPSLIRTQFSVAYSWRSCHFAQLVSHYHSVSMIV